MPRKSPKPTGGPLWDLIAGVDGEHDDELEGSKLATARRDLIRHWSEHPWNYVTGRDTDGRPIVWTKDERDPEAPVKPFPSHLDYLREWYEVLFRERLIFCDKPRQMYITTSTMLYIDWECMFRDARLWLISKTTEDEAKDILRDKIRFPHSQMPQWLQKARPVKDKPQVMVPYPATSSAILAVAENVAQRDARGKTASGVLVDEAARQREFQQIMAAALPMATKIIAVTTAELGNPGAITFRKYITEGL